MDEYIQGKKIAQSYIQGLSKWLEVVPQTWRAVDPGS